MRTGPAVVFSASPLKTLRSAALSKFNLYLSLPVGCRNMYLPVRERRTVHSLNSPIRPVWNGMFKVYWCHIHDLHAGQKQQWLCDFTDNKNTTQIKRKDCQFVILGTAWAAANVSVMCSKNCEIVTGIECWDKKISNKYKTRSGKLQK